MGENPAIVVAMEQHQDLAVQIAALYVRSMARSGQADLASQTLRGIAETFLGTPQATVFKKLESKLEYRKQQAQQPPLTSSISEKTKLTPAKRQHRFQSGRLYRI